MHRKAKVAGKLHISQEHRGKICFWRWINEENWDKDYSLSVPLDGWHRVRQCGLDGSWYGWSWDHTVILLHTHKLGKTGSDLQARSVQAPGVHLQESWVHTGGTTGAVGKVPCWSKDCWPLAWLIQFVTWLFFCMFCMFTCCVCREVCQGRKIMLCQGDLLLAVLALLCPFAAVGPTRRTRLHPWHGAVQGLQTTLGRGAELSHTCAWCEWQTSSFTSGSWTRTALCNVFQWLLGSGGISHQQIDKRLFIKLDI